MEKRELNLYFDNMNTIWKTPMVMQEHVSGPCFLIVNADLNRETVMTFLLSALSAVNESNFEIYFFG